MPHRGLDIARIAAATREGLDALRAARGVVDRAQHEVEPPEDLVGGQRRQALPQRRDKGAARLVEVVGDELREERRVFGRDHGAQARVLVAAVAALNLGERGPDEGFDHGLERQSRSPCLGEQAQALGVERRAMPPVDLGEQPVLAAEVVADE